MQRIDAIDLLRGIAVLGILIMNIQSFSMPGSAYINPASYGDLMGVNKWVWILSHVFADQKFMSIFSMLFGAGIILLTDKLIATDRPVRRTWYSRIFWLLIFGLMHAWLLWYGDILIYYAIAGCIVFFMRNRSTKFLFRIGIVFFIIPIALNLFNYASYDFIPQENIEEIETIWHPSEAEQQNEVDIYLGNYAGKLKHRMHEWVGMFIYFFLFTGLWRIISMMVFGMYLYKKGIITGARDSSFYKKMCVTCFATGLPIITYGVWHHFNTGWTAQYSLFFGSQFNYVGSFLMALSYLALIMLFSKSQVLEKIKVLFQKVGKMAFTNYILQSVICTFYFNSLGFFGSTTRVMQMVITVVVWIILLLFTHLWFNSFKMGPLEWLWRSLTYWKWARLR